MTGPAVRLPGEPGDSVLIPVRVLLRRAAAASGHPALSEAQHAALIGSPPGSAADSTGAATLRAAVLEGEDGTAGRALGFAQALPTPPDGHYALEVVRDPEAADPEAVGAGLLRAIVSQVASGGGGLVRLWRPWTAPEHERWITASGFSPERDLLQLRCRLPLPPDGRTATPTRPFRPGQDEAAWLRANNRAFAGHPEQGGWDLDTLRRREAQPWFDPAGFLLHDEDGVIAGWCWTKVHRETDPPMGEIYVIGVVPDFQGRGLGRALARAGLDWLAEAGLPVGMLYVDSANTAGLALYRSLGFTVDHTDRAYVRTVGGRPPA